MNQSAIIAGQDTQLFALKSIMKQWELKLRTGMVSSSLKTSPQFKKAVLGHLKSLFKVDDTFDGLKGKECYNGIVGALTHAGVWNTSFIKEIYTKKQSEFLAKRGQRIDDIHIV